jgi:integrase
MVLSWAEKQGMIAKAPYIEMPPRPKPKDAYLTREQSRILMDAAILPHVRLYSLLALSTGARNAALLELTWTRCDLERGLIDLRDPDRIGPAKGRAIVPMTNALRVALQEARAGALSPYVIEWAGQRVASVKKGLAAAAKRAGLPHVSPHMLRHSAAVHMAESGVPMAEIAAVLGHSNTRVTEAVYAKFSPTYLRKAVSALEYGFNEPKERYPKRA